MKNKFKSIDNLNIIINFLKILNQNSIEIDVLCGLIKYLYNSMKDNNLVGKYRILFDYSKDSILATAINNQNILTIDATGNYINLIDDIDINKKERLFKKYFVSTEIDNIINEFIKQKYFIHNEKIFKTDGGIL